MDVLTGVASILNLTSVSVCRYVEITRTYTYHEIITKHRVTGSLIFIWFFATAMAALKAFIPRHTMYVCQMIKTDP